MKEPYLIQRCLLRNPYPKRDDIKGIDSIFSMDYMGSAEFEWGALPASLRALTSCLDKVVLTQTSLKATDGRSVFVVCFDSDQAEAVAQVEKLATERAIRTKEHVGLERALKCDYKGYVRQDLVAWWDIDNHWFACLGKPVAKDVLLGLARLAERWKKEGKI